MQKSDYAMGFILVVFLAFVVATWVHGEERHHQGKVVVKETVERIVNTTISTNGVALSLATSQHQFDWSTDRLQGSVGVGVYKGESAVSIGLGKRFGKVLVNGAVGESGGSVGVNWRF